MLAARHARGAWSPTDPSEADFSIRHDDARGARRPLHVRMGAAREPVGVCRGQRDAPVTSAAQHAVWLSRQSDFRWLPREGRARRVLIM